MASIAVMVILTITTITCSRGASITTEKDFTTRLLGVLNPPETIFPESNKGSTLSSSGKNVVHVDYERERRHYLPDIIGGDGGRGSVMFFQSSQSNLNWKDDSTFTATTIRERRHALSDIIGGDDSTNTATTTDDTNMLRPPLKLHSPWCWFCICCCSICIPT